MPTNYYMFFVAALIPMVIGAIYFHEKVFGGAWMKINGFTKEELSKANMGLIFGISFIFSVLVAFILASITIHQTQVLSVLTPEVTESGSTIQQDFAAFMTKYGGRYRTFGHGAFHGVLISIFLVFPIISINALFERRGWKYIFIHFGYWLISLALMGGLVCSTLVYPTVS